jgi:uncharacterized surface protein with fasciclin (FAS1) repeats
MLSLLSPVSPVSCRAAGAAAEKACDPSLDTIGTLAANTPELSTLAAAVAAANLTDFLSTPGPIDVLAPTNDAFEELLKTIGASVEDLLAETSLLTRVLQYHVLVDEDGAVCNGTLVGPYGTALPGEMFIVLGSTVKDASGNTANIVSTVPAGNGVVYVVDRVLLPSPDSSAPAPEPSAETPATEGLDLQGAFKLIDANGDGKITEDELRAAAAQAGSKLSEGQVQAFLAADKNGDGVNASEFLFAVNRNVAGLF